MNEYLGQLIGSLAIGAYLMFTGWRAGWKGDFKSLYRWKKMTVAEENQPTFLRHMGLSQIVAGAGVALMGPVNLLTRSTVGGWLAIGGVLCGAVLMATTLFRFARKR